MEILVTIEYSNKERWRNKLRFVQIEYFLALQEKQSLRETARRLNVAPSTISTALNGLEKELGCELFTKEKKGIVFTDKGRRIYEIMQEIEKELLAIGRLKANFDNALNEKLFVAGGSLLCNILLTEALVDFQKEYKDVEVGISATDNIGVIERIVDNHAHLGLLQINSEKKKKYQYLFELHDLVFQPLFIEEMCFIVGPRSSFYEQTTVSLSEILSNTLLAERYPIESVTMSYLRQYGYKGDTLIIEDLVALHNLIAATEYVAFTCISAAKESFRVYDNGLRILRIEPERWETTTGYIYQRKSLRFIENLFIEKLSSCCAKFNC